MLLLISGTILVYGIWYVVYGMKMAFTVYSHMFFVCRARAAYNSASIPCIYIYMTVLDISLSQMNTFGSEWILEGITGAKQGNTFYQ